MIVALSSGTAWAEKRIALVVGNSGYQTVPQLPNPSRDAAAVGRMFKEAGFDSVEVLLDLGNLEFKRAMRKFEADADQADIAVIYYAGHGIEINGANYLIPVDARLVSDRDAEDEAIRLERMVLSADGAKKLRVIILDACRDNPFTVKMRRERRAALRAISSGLGQVEPTSTDTLIAYAAKAGSTAEDGEGSHSPFTTALLKNLTVPGLDIRLAFGRVRDEVMKLTGSRQEPFVYGSLGGGNISLVPPPAVEKEPEAADIKADFELVAKINSPRAWEVFINTYKTGFYADLARAQLASLSTQSGSAVVRDAGAGNVTVAALPAETPAPVYEPSSRERLEFDRLRESTNVPALKRFIRRYPDSPLALQVEQRVELLERAAAEREEKARAEREAARLAAEQARVEAERRKAELAARKKREDEERRAREAEAAQQARAAEAERKAAEAKQRAEEAERRAAELAATRKAAEAARQKAESERAAKLAEQERQRAEEERRKAELARQKEEACKSEESRLNDLTAKGGEGKGLDDLKAFAREVTCERLQPQIASTVKEFEDEAERRLTVAVQTELVRVGCLAGEADGQFGPVSKAALARYQSAKGRAADAGAAITQETAAELAKESGRVCPLECKAGETAKGDVCVADVKPEPPVTAERSKSEPERKSASKPERKQERKPERAQANRKSEPAPRARQEASRPTSSYRGGATMIGVGF